MHLFHAFTAFTSGIDRKTKLMRQKRRTTSRAAIFTALLLSSLVAQAAPRLTDLQYIGSHNSYHAGFAPSEAALLKQLDPALFTALDTAIPH